LQRRHFDEFNFIAYLKLYLNINIHTKILEIYRVPQSYIATVRVVLRDSSMTARTTITADTVQQAKLTLTRMYGDGNVLNITQIMFKNDAMTEGTKTLSPPTASSQGSR
jgi:hypothetical protein